MDKIAVLKKKNYICVINVKNLCNHSTNNFKLIRKKKLTSLTHKVEKKFD